MKYTNSKRLQVQQVEITQSYVEKLFNDCNLLYFNNKLPPIPITLITSTIVNGDFTYDINFETNMLLNMQIQINTSNRRTRNKLIATMVHEMLHYKVALELTPEEIKRAGWYYKDGQLEKFNEIMHAGQYAHTNKWLEYANTINNTYNLNINLK